jgi:hypothetical protein
MREGGLKPLQMAHAWAALCLEVLVDFKVGGVEQEDAVCRPLITTRATDLLNILFQGSGSLVMQDVADVRFVDAHAEGRCCDHDQAPRRIHELALCCVTIGSTHLSVIARDGDARTPQGAWDFVDRGGGGAIDDAGALQALDAPGGSGELRRAGHDIDGEAQVLAVRRCYDHPWVVQPQPCGDVLTNSRRCCCRKG